MEELVRLGRVTKPHGLRGEVRVHLYNPDSELVFGLTQVFLLLETPRSVPIEGTRAGPGGVVLARLAGTRSRDEAEALRGQEIGVPRSLLPDLGEAQWYHHDLIGLDVVNAAGTRLGQVVGVLDYPTIDCLVVQLDAGFSEVPMIEPYFDTVALEQRAVVVGDISDLPVVDRSPIRSPG